MGRALRLGAALTCPPPHSKFAAPHPPAALLAPAAASSPSPCAVHLAAPGGCAGWRRGSFPRRLSPRNLHVRCAWLPAQLLEDDGKTREVEELPLERVRPLPSEGSTAVPLGRFMPGDAVDLFVEDGWWKVGGC